jgi:hypothetical protein
VCAELSGVVRTAAWRKVRPVKTLISRVRRAHAILAAPASCVAVGHLYLRLEGAGQGRSGVRGRAWAHVSKNGTRPMTRQRDRRPRLSLRRTSRDHTGAVCRGRDPDLGTAVAKGVVLCWLHGAGLGSKNIQAATFGNHPALGTGCLNIYMMRCQDGRAGRLGQLGSAPCPHAPHAPCATPPCTTLHACGG